ncbi:MAG: hypothetical protein K2P55_09190, partial [Bacteroides acidifaciens]|nr:hypothetical protein [Bacteroides acidifaciens]
KETATEKLYASSLQANPLGSYYESEDKNTQFYSDLLFNVNKKLGDFSINATLGSSICDTKFDNSYIDGALGVVNQFNLSGLDKHGALTIEIKTSIITTGLHHCLCLRNWDIKTCYFLIWADEWNG